MSDKMSKKVTHKVTNKNLLKTAVINAHIKRNFFIESQVNQNQNSIMSEENREKQLIDLDLFEDVIKNHIHKSIEKLKRQKTIIIEKINSDRQMIKILMESNGMTLNCFKPRNNGWKSTVHIYERFTKEFIDNSDAQIEILSDLSDAIINDVKSKSKVSNEIIWRHPIGASHSTIADPNNQIVGSTVGQSSDSRVRT